jgi:hypothetical protein
MLGLSIRLCAAVPDRRGPPKSSVLQIDMVLLRPGGHFYSAVNKCVKLSMASTILRPQNPPKAHRYDDEKLYLCLYDGALYPSYLGHGCLAVWKLARATWDRIWDGVLYADPYPG